VPQLGGAGNLWANVTIANDTGSSIQTIFQNDLTNLNYVNGYRGRLGLMPICDAGGVVTYLERIRIEVMLIGQDGRTEITGWFVEDAVVRRNQPGVRRLSGMNMRRQLYFATPRGNASLFVAERKNGIVKQLPV
jgi:hypothetical protein